MSHTLVIAELHEGKVKKSTLSAITFARQVSQPFDILAIGAGAAAAASELTGFGAGKVLTADDASLANYICERFAPTVAAAQRVFISQLDADLADGRGARVLLAIDAFQVALGDGADVAQGVYGERAVWVGPCEARADIDARKIEAVYGKACHVRLIEAQTDWHTVERAPRAHDASRIVELVGFEQADAHEAAQRGIDIAHFFGHEFELISRLVFGEDYPVTVVDDAARGGLRFDAYAIALGEIGVAIVLDDLQPDEATEDHRRQQGDDHRGGERALFEEPLLAP